MPTPSNEPSPSSFVVVKVPRAWLRPLLAVALVALGAVPSWMLATTLATPIPHTFANGSVANAAQVNANFAALAQKSVRLVTNNVGSFTLTNGASVVHAATCAADEVATGGGCTDSGYKDFYLQRPTATNGFECGWYNTSGATRNYALAAAYVLCLK